MKIQCNVCEMAEATILCCADEAALCLACDEKIHASNKVAGKHLRVPLSSSPSKMPRCDICRESTGFFFCVEDRALFCRKCDVSIHSANEFVSAHQRFLLTGVKVGLESKEPILHPTKEKENFVERPKVLPSIMCNSLSLPSENKNSTSNQTTLGKGLSMSKISFSGGSSHGFIPDWPLEEFFGLNDFHNNFGLTEQGFSKGDGVKPGDSEWSPMYRNVAEDVDVEDYMGNVPEITWTVPEIPSPPTASGLYWPMSSQSNHLLDSSIYVPDICNLQNDSSSQLPTVKGKRRRQF